MTEEERKRRALILAALGLLLADTRKELFGLLDGVASRRITAPEFGRRAFDILRTAHVSAAVFGRRLAGDTRATGPADRAIGLRIAADDSPRLASFVADIEAGRYDQEEQADATSAEELSMGALRARAGLYARRLVGTANSGWQEAIPDDMLLWWELGPNENHCRQCPALAASSPRPARDWPTMPGLLATDCGVNCACTMRAADGRQSVRLTG